MNLLKDEIKAGSFILHIEGVKNIIGLSITRIDIHKPSVSPTGLLIKATEYWFTYRNEPLKTAIGEVFDCTYNSFSKHFLHQDGEPAEDIQFWKSEITSKLEESEAKQILEGKNG